jgi:RimJ/RimL family protein N-acetyltransferase
VIVTGRGRVSDFLVGDRIYLREIRLSDVNETYHHWMNDPEVTRYTESRFFPNSMEALQKYVSRVSGDRQHVFLAIVLKKDDRHIGNIKLGSINWIHRFANVGLLIGEKDCWGQGYGTEAIRLVTEYAFRVLDLRRLTAGSYSNNISSFKAFLKAGWQQEGIRKRQYFSNGEYVDEILLGVERLAG